MRMYCNYDKYSRFHFRSKIAYGVRNQITLAAHNNHAHTQYAARDFQTEVKSAVCLNWD